MAARVAHNHEVLGSSPSPATKEKALSQDRAFSLVTGISTDQVSLEVLGETCQWHVGNRLSDENLFSIVKSGGRQR